MHTDILADATSQYLNQLLPTPPTDDPNHNNNNNGDDDDTSAEAEAATQQRNGYLIAVAVLGLLVVVGVGRFLYAWLRSSSASPSSSAAVASKQQRRPLLNRASPRSEQTTARDEHFADTHPETETQTTERAETRLASQS